MAFSLERIPAGFCDRELSRDQSRRMPHGPTQDLFSQQMLLFRLEESRRDFLIAITAVVLHVENAIDMCDCAGVESPVGAA